MSIRNWLLPLLVAACTAACAAPAPGSSTRGSNAAPATQMEAAAPVAVQTVPVTTVPVPSVPVPTVPAQTAPIQNAPAGATPARTVPVQTAPAQSASGTRKPPPPMSDPLPPEVMPMPVSPHKPLVIDQSCRTNADCAVKNVGSCCGSAPACVNRNSRTDPTAVQAQCAKDGRVSACMSNPITACTCVNRQCIPEREPVGGWINGTTPPQTDR